MKRVVLNLTRDQAVELQTVLKDTRCYPELCKKLEKRLDKTIIKQKISEKLREQGIESTKELIQKAMETYDGE